MRTRLSPATTILLWVTAIPIILINVGVFALLGWIIYGAFANSIVIGVFLMIMLGAMFVFAGYVAIQFRKRLEPRRRKVLPPEP